MEMVQNNGELRATNRIRFSLSGALAGIISTLAFTIIHEIFISDIWFALVALVAAGAGIRGA